VRLASQLTGWKLDIISEARFRQMEEQALAELGRIASVSEEMVKSFYRMGFRSLDEVVEAPDDELLTIDGIRNAEQAERIRRDAAQALETHRRERVVGAKSRAEALTDRDHLLLCQGVTDRIVDALEQAGYRSAQDVMRETDVDRLAIRTGLGIQKAQEIKAGVARYVSEDMEAVQAAQREAQAQAQAEAAHEGEV
jgi:N utilization substance protein A